MQVSALLAVTVTVAFFLRRLRQPMIIAYLLAGIASGPVLLNLLAANRPLYDVLAQFGIVLLLFIIGLNLNFHYLKSIARAAFITGLGQFIFTAVIGFLILTAFALPAASATYLAIAITFSSTIIIFKLLLEKKDTEKIYGKYTIGLMLAQDVIAILILAALGVLKGGGAGGLLAAGGPAGALALLGLKGLLVIGGLYLLARHFLSKLLNKAAATSELLFLLTVAWCFGVASVLYLAGFSLEIGAVAAGITLSASPYQPEIASRLKPLRDFFLVIFFLLLGSQMALSDLSAVWLTGLILALFVLVGNPLILYGLFRLLRFTRRNSFLIGLTAAQVSEFGFVILFTAQQLGYVRLIDLSIFTLVAIFTIFTSSYFIIYNERLYRWLLPFFALFGPDRYRQFDQVPGRHDVWLIGYHRIGRKVAAALRQKQTNFAVIDFDPAVIEALKREKTSAYFGDISDIEFLADLPITSARLVVMTIPSAEDQENLIKHLRQLNKKTLIIANAYHFDEAWLLYRAGADYVMMPHYLGGSWMAKVLTTTPWTRRHFGLLRAEQDYLKPAPLRR